MKNPTQNCFEGHWVVFLPSIFSCYNAPVEISPYLKIYFRAWITFIMNNYLNVLQVFILIFGNFVKLLT